MGFGFLSAAGGLLSAGVGSIAGLWQQRENKKMMREQMAYQTQEREASQAFQSGEREASQAYQTAEREAQNQYQEDIYNKYQSPEAMVSQYQAAGLNGKLAVEGAGSLGTMSASSGSSGGAPSGSAPSGASIPAPYQNTNALSSSFVDMANALKALGEAKEKGLNVDYLKKTFDDRVKQEDLRSKGMEIANMVANSTNKKLEKELEKFVIDIEEGKARIEQIRELVNLARKDGKLKDLDIETYTSRLHSLLALQNAQTSNTIADTSLKGAQEANTKADTQLKWDEHSLLDLRKELMNSQLASNSSVIQLNNSLFELNEIEKDIKNATSENEKLKLKEEYHAAELKAIQEANEVRQLLDEHPSMRKLRVRLGQWARAPRGK